MRTKQNGFTLISVLVTSTLAAIVLVSLGKMIGFVHRSERGIAANMNLTDMDILFHLVTENTESCAKSGLIGIDLTSLLQPTPAPIPLILRYPAPSAEGPVAIEAGSVFGGTRKIETFEATSLTAIGASPSTTYFATLSLKTSILGKATSMRNPDKKYLLKVNLDSSNKIAECSSTSLPSSGGNGQCQEGEVMTGIDFVTKSVICKKAKFGGSFSWLGGNGFPYYGTTTFIQGDTNHANVPHMANPHTSHCWSGNPLHSNWCGCPEGYTEKLELHIDFNLEGTLNLGGGFSCTANAPGQVCAFNVTTCYAD